MGAGMTKPTPHPHAALIAEAVLDLRRTILKKNTDGGNWYRVPLETVVLDEGGNFEFSLSDTAPQKHKIVSSLSDDELRRINYEVERTAQEARRAIVNAAAQRAIEDFVENMNTWSETQDTGTLYLQDYLSGRVGSYPKEGKL